LTERVQALRHRMRLAPEETAVIVFMGSLVGVIAATIFRHPTHWSAHHLPYWLLDWWHPFGIMTLSWLLCYFSGTYIVVCRRRQRTAQPIQPENPAIRTARPRC
jgi:hypothetical protein